MPPEETTVKFILDKPLHQLTEDDITQVTREDCRRYLKEKGMRRPSWNKSQAIQQVIMLKKLLEASPNSEAGSHKRPRISRPDNSQNSNTAILENVTKGTRGDAENSVSAEETTAYHRKDPDRTDSSGGFPGRFVTGNDDSAQERGTDATNMLSGQMTIFYCGKVNVYDDVPANKAQEILHAAASPLHIPEGQVVDGTTIPQPLLYISKAVNTKARQDSAAVVLPNFGTVKMNDNSAVLGEVTRALHEETHVEGTAGRKASVQRYLEKKKDRFKSNRKTGMASPSSLDLSFNHHIPRSSTYSPPQISSRSTPTCCSSADNDSVKSACLSAGLRNQGL